MFQNLWNRIKEVIRKMFGVKTVERALHMTPVISSDMITALELWEDMYKDRSPWIKSPNYADPTEVVSLGLPSFIASEKARMATLEMKSEITAPSKNSESEDDDETYSSPEPNKSENNARAKYLDKYYHEKVLDKLRIQLEYGLAIGGLVIKPYVVINSKNEPVIEIEFIKANSFFPLAFDGAGKITEAAFVQTVSDKDVTYRRLEYHKLEGDKIIVKNRAFKSLNTQDATPNANDLGQEIPLASVPEWKDMQEEIVIENVDRLLFAYFKNPEANTIDPSSPLGMSAYGRAVKLIEQADKQYSRMLWEFEATEAAIDIDRNALMDVEDSKGNFHSVRPIMQQRLFRKVDLGDDNTYEPFLPQIRDAALINGLNTILMRIEDVCALSRGTISTTNIEAKTATELKILKQRSYSMNQDIQHALELALRDVIYIMDVYATLYNATPEGEYEVSFEWDDSILVDTEEELGKRLQLVQNGISSKVELRMWYFGETESQATKALEVIARENAEAIRQNAELQNQIASQTYGLNNTQNRSVENIKTENKNRQDNKNQEGNDNRQDVTNSNKNVV